LDTKVKHELVILPNGDIDLTANPHSSILVEIENKNKEAVAALNAAGLDGDGFIQAAPKRKSEKKIAVTIPGSKERQDLIATAHTAGKKFIATGGRALNEVDAFIGMQRTKNIDRVKVLANKKASFENYALTVDKAKTVIARKLLDQVDVFSHDFVAHPDSIKIDDLKLIIEYKSGKKPPSKHKKTQMIGTWMNIKHQDSNDYSPKWTVQEEEEMNDLNKDNIKLHDTELGRQAVKFVQSAAAGCRQIPAEEVTKACTKDDIETLRKIVNAFDAQEVVILNNVAHI